MTYWLLADTISEKTGQKIKQKFPSRGELPLKLRLGPSRLQQKRNRRTEKGKIENRIKLSCQFFGLVTKAIFSQRSVRISFLCCRMIYIGRLGIEERRVEEYERTDYQGASFGEIIEVCTVLGVEFERAIIRVDFEEIEAVAKSVEKWEKDKRNIIASAS